MTTIFVSYTKEDIPLAQVVADHLRSHGFSVWIDHDHLIVGDRLHPEIQAALSAASILVPILTKRYVESGWALAELQHALTLQDSMGTISVLPIRFDGSQLPDYLPNLVFADARTKPELGLEQLLTAVRRTLDPRNALTSGEREHLVASLAEHFPSHQLARLVWRQAGGNSDDIPFSQKPETLWWKLLRRPEVDGTTIARLLRVATSLEPDVEEFFRLRKRRVLRLLEGARYLKHLENLETQLSDLVTRARVLGKSIGLDLSAHHMLPSSKTEYLVAVVGPFSAGKSTLINALLNRTLLPETNQSCTPCPTSISYATTPEDEGLRAYYISSDELRVTVNLALGQAGLDSDQITDFTTSSNWPALRTLLAQTPSSEDLLAKQSLALASDLVGAAAEFSRLLGSTVTGGLERLADFRAPPVGKPAPSVLLREIVASVHHPLLRSGVTLVDTPGITSQHQLHRDWTFRVVGLAHALVVVESFVAPNQRGIEELMDIFVRNRSEAGGGMGVTNNVFVVLNKCDQESPQSLPTQSVALGTSRPGRTHVAPRTQTTEATISQVADYYHGHWGVERGHCFATSASTIQEELDGRSQVDPRTDTETLVRQFAAFRGTLESYLVDQVLKLDLDARVKLTLNFCDKIEVTLELSLNSLRVGQLQREALLERYLSSQTRLSAATDEFEVELSHKRRVLTGRALDWAKSAVDNDFKWVYSDAENFYSNFGVFSGIASRYLPSVYYAALPRRLSANVLLWAKTVALSHISEVTESVTGPLQERVANVVREVAGDNLWETERITLTTLEEFLLELPSVSKLRVLFEHARGATRIWTKWSFHSMLRRYESDVQCLLEQSFTRLIEGSLGLLQEQARRSVGDLGDRLASSIAEASVRARHNEEADAASIEKLEVDIGHHSTIRRDLLEYRQRLGAKCNLTTKSTPVFHATNMPFLGTGGPVV